MARKNQVSKKRRARSASKQQAQPRRNDLILQKSRIKATAGLPPEPGGSEESLQVLAGRLIRVQEDERRTVARELHDGLNQALAMLRVELSIVLTRIPLSSKSVRMQLTKIRDRVEQLSDEVRQISHRLHPAVLEHLGLVSALRSYCSEFSEYQRVQALFAHEGPTEPVPYQLAVCLYRIVQEALQNAVKHARANTVWVNLNCRAREMKLSIADDGQGFDVAQARRKSGLGLVSMEERARIVGGSLSINSRVGSGTRIEVVIPDREVLNHGNLH
jgi:signal transduction histidine kinase